MSSSKLSMSSLDLLSGMVERDTSTAHGSGCGCQTCCSGSAAASTSPRSTSSSSGSLGSLWKQSGGKGTPLTLTYSLTSGFLSGINGVPRWQVKAAVEKAFSVFAKYVPIRFVETVDRGPSTQALLKQYRPAGNEAKLRFHRRNIDGNGGTIAEAYFPGEGDSIAGDMFFDDERWDPGLFVETVLHELGHALGMKHVSGVDAILNPVLKRRFTRIGSADLLPDDIKTIRRAYGTGKGSVQPLGSDQPASPPSSGDDRATIRGTKRGDLLVGSSRNQAIYGREGNDTLLGKAGRDKLYGAQGSDDLRGGAGQDRLVGTWLGKGEKDRLTGGKQADLFVLGTQKRALYDDAKSGTLGTKDYALVTDFRRSDGDVIQLSSKFEYRLGSAPKGVASGRAIFINNPGETTDELVGVVRGLGNLGLNSSAFIFV